MQFEIWDARNDEDVRRWRAAHAAWPTREVFAHPAYVRLFANGRDEPLAAFARTRSGFVLYPFILRPIDAQHLLPAAVGRVDLTSPYGYGGAFRHRVDEVEAKEFWSMFEDFCARRGVVAEFSRLSLFDDQRLAYPGHTEQRLTNVVRDLRTPLDQMWREFAHKVRKNVNRARRDGVTVETDPAGLRLDDFLRVYCGTMDRRAAEPGFYFPREFFTTIIQELAGQFMFFHALRDGRVISSELVLLSAENMYSFLGGTEREAFDSRPNDLLKFEACRWGQENGRERFVLGGGFRPDDGIFHYKRSFAPNGLLPYLVGTRIFDDRTYTDLCLAHQRECVRRNPNWEASPSFFPAYRQQPPVS